MIRKIFIFSTSLLLCSCANNIVPLSGGTKDEKAPELIKSNIKETEFNERSIVLDFDEYIDLNNPSENIKIFPEHTKLKFDVSKKRVIIKFDTLLLSETTYFLQIDKGIKDVNEGNTYSYEKIFSTGKQIDSSYIRVSIPEFNLYKNLKLALLEESPSDSLRKFNPYYLRNISSETISILGLKKKKYHIWVFTDQNFDSKPDWYQPTGFIQNCSTDSNYTLEIKEWKKPFKISKFQTDGSYYKIHYTHSDHYNHHLYEIVGNQIKNALYYNEDSAVFSSLKLNIRQDTLLQIPVIEELESIIRKDLKLIRFKNQYIVQYMLPQLYSNTDEKNIKIRPSQTIYTNKPEYLQLYDPINESMDSFDLKKVQEIDAIKLSLLKIEIEDQFNQLYDIKIIKDKKTLMKLFDVRNQEFFLEPGEYRIEIYERDFTHPFNPFEYQNPRSLIYAKDLILKASWDEIMQVKIK